MRQTLSIAMIAMNEEANLPRTLDSVRWADEIVIVDSGSTDRTLEIAHSFGAKTTYHAITGHGEQKNIALVEDQAAFLPLPNSRSRPGGSSTARPALSRSSASTTTSIRCRSAMPIAR